jgi:hypothetical protein
VILLTAIIVCKISFDTYIHNRSVQSRDDSQLEKVDILLEQLNNQINATTSKKQ